MALLVGRSDIGAFSGNGFAGFGSGNASTVTHTAGTNGTADTLNASISDFGLNTVVACAIYEQTGGAGDFNLVRTLDIPSGAAPQAVTISPALNITEGNVYRVAFFGDHTSQGANGGDGYQLNIDPSIVSPDGVGSIAGEYSSIPSTLNSVTREVDGEYFWNLDGTDTGPSSNLGVTITLETKNQPGTLEPDKSYNVTVLDSSDLSVLVATASQTSVSGVLLVDNQSLGAVDDWVIMVVEDPAEADPLARTRAYRVQVFDQDA